MNYEGFYWQILNWPETIRQICSSRAVQPIKKWFSSFIFRRPEEVKWSSVSEGKFRGKLEKKRSYILVAKHIFFPSLCAINHRAFTLVLQPQIIFLEKTHHSVGLTERQKYSLVVKDRWVMSGFLRKTISGQVQTPRNSHVKFITEFYFNEQTADFCQFLSLKPAKGGIKHLLEDLKWNRLLEANFQPHRTNLKWLVDWLIDRKFICNNFGDRWIL